MIQYIIPSLIAGVCSIVAVVITNNSTTLKIQAQLDKNQAVSDTKLTELTREVREHNEFAKRMPTLEHRVNVIEARLDKLVEGRI